MGTSSSPRGLLVLASTVRLFHGFGHKCDYHGACRMPTNKIVTSDHSVTWPNLLWALGLGIVEEDDKFDTKYQIRYTSHENIKSSTLYT